MRVHCLQVLSKIYHLLVSDVPFNRALLMDNQLNLVVQVAGLDPLRDEGIAYAEKLKASG